MKNIKTQQEIKAIEEAVAKATGWENIEIILPVSMQDLPSVDYRLLEMENKLNVSRNRQTPRESKQAARSAARTSFMNKATQAIDSVLDVIAEPGKLLNIKPIGAVAHYFFLLEEDEVKEPVVTEQVAEPVAQQVVKEGNVVYVNFNK